VSALLAAIAADLGVRPRDLVTETGRALIAAPFVLAGLVALMVLLAAVSA
jgi:hypothetical protein